MHRILIVEDEASMRLGLSDNLEFEGYQVDSAADGDEGYIKAMAGDYDLLILDIMMPGMTGFEVLKKLRKKGSEVPVLFLSAKGEEIDKVLGLELGADDFMTKPFSLRELSARVKAILRRFGKITPQEQNEVKVGRLAIDFKSYSAREEGEEVTMSHKEYEIIAYLLRHSNEVVTRFQLLESVWGYDEQPTTRTVDNFIVKLRQKIEVDPNHPKIIITVHGAGYKLIM